MTNKSIKPEEFVVIWQSAKSRTEAIAKLGRSASSRAFRLRMKGVPLKKFSKKHEPVLNVEALKRLALAYAPG